MGDDGYPRPLWDKSTGKIDREVANYMRDHGFDLTYYTKTNWQEIGPKLKGKINVYCGDMDNFYLNLAVYLFEDFMKTTNAAANFEYGRPMKGHGWHPYEQRGTRKNDGGTGAEEYAVKFSVILALASTFLAAQDPLFRQTKIRSSTSARTWSSSRLGFRTRAARPSMASNLSSSSSKTTASPSL